MNKLLIVRADNSIESQSLSYADFTDKLSSSVAQYDITDTLTMWVTTNDESAGYNSVANSAYADYRGMNDSFFYGEVIFTGKSTLSGVYGLDADAEALVMNYANKEN